MYLKCTVCSLSSCLSCYTPACVTRLLILHLYNQDSSIYQNHNFHNCVNGEDHNCVNSLQEGLRGYVVQSYCQYLVMFFHNFFSDLLSLYYNKDIFKFCLFCKCFKGNIYTQSVHFFPVYIDTTHMHCKYRHKLVLSSV